MQQLALTHVTLFEQRWRVTLRVRNPNDHRLSVRGLDYRVLLDGQPFAEGATAASFVLPAQGDTLVSTELSTRLLQDFDRIRALLGGDGSLPYTIEGKARLGTLPVPVGFSWHGHWPEPSSDASPPKSP